MNKQEIDKAIEILNYYTPIGATNAGFKPKEEEIHEDTKAFNLAISALEKQIPKGIQKKVVGWKIDCFCPSCTLEVFSNQSYCSVCGQYLNWSQ